MPDDLVVFETTELRVIRAVEMALSKAKLPFRLDLPKPTLQQVGPKKPKLRVFTAEADFDAAAELIEQTLIRFGRVRSLQTKVEPYPEYVTRIPIVYFPFGGV